MILDYETTGDIENAKLQFFQNLYEEARRYSDEQRVKYDRNLAQYKGSSDIDGSEKPAKVVRNITYELIESQTSSYLPNPSVSPKMQNEKNERNAKNIESLLRCVRDKLPFEKMNDLDERFNPIYGGSVWLIEWDDSIITHNTVGDVKVTCLNPKKFTGQPNIYEISDMEYCFIEFETTKDEIVRRYGVSISVAETTESDENDDDKTATIYVCYYKNKNDKVSEYVWSADTELLDIDDYYSRKREICTKCGKKKELCNCENPKFEKQSEEFEELDHDIVLTEGGIIPAMSEVYKDGQIVMEEKQTEAILDDGSVAVDDINGVLMPVMTTIQVPKMEKTKLPFFTPNILPIVIRKNISEEDNLFGQSDCEVIRHQQQEINKIESRISEKVLGSGVFPIVPESFNQELDNSLWKKVFRANQANAKLFGRVDLQVDISNDIKQADRLYDQAKRILGITDSYQGQYDSSAQSGKAKQLQISQAAGRLDSKRQMKNAAYAEIDHIIFQYYLAYADEPRPVTYKDAQGRLQNTYFNRYDFIERDDAGEYYYNDEYLFSADSSLDIETQRTALWEENRKNFQEGAYGEAGSIDTLLIFWQNMEKLHYPFAHDNVERLREEQAKLNQMAAMQGQIDQLNSEVTNQKAYNDYIQGFLGGGNSALNASQTQGSQGLALNNNNMINQGGNTTQWQ